MLSQQILHVGLNRVLILIRNESMTDPKVFRNESISVALIIFLRVRSFARRPFDVRCLESMSQEMVASWSWFNKTSFAIINQQMRCFGNTSSHLNNEVKKHWAWMVLGWETTWELQMLLAWVWILMLQNASGQCQSDTLTCICKV